MSIIGDIRAGRGSDRGHRDRRSLTVAAQSPAGELAALSTAAGDRVAGAAGRWMYPRSRVGATLWTPRRNAVHLSWGGGRVPKCGPPDRAVSGGMVMAELNDVQMRSVLAGMSYPAFRWEIIVWAEYNGAGPSVLDALHEIPRRVYAGSEEVLAAVMGSERQ